MSPRRPNLSPLYHMPRKMKQDYFVVYSRILIGGYCDFQGGAGGQGMGGVALEEGQSEGAPEGDYGQKDRFPPKMTVKTGKCCKKKKQ